MFNSRVKNLQLILKKNNYDALLVTNFYNILYLTGFKTLTENEREAFVIVTQKNVYLITDERYIIQKSKFKSQKYNSKVKSKFITTEKNLIANIKEVMLGERIRQLGFEGEDLRVNELQKLKKQLTNVELVSTEKLIIVIREIKDRQEITKIKKACEIGDRCLSNIIKTIKFGQTEKEIAWRIEKWIREKNYEIAFEPIVAIDKNSAIPHYLTKEGNERVKHNSLILIDFGVKYQDYCSDMTRMIFVGKPSEQIFRTYNLLLKIQEKTIKQCSNRAILKSIDQYCRKLITDCRLPNYPHSTGHGVGLEVHEYPKISTHSKDILKAGQAFTIEPGIYFAGKWGMRIEDTVLVENNSKMEVLTKFSKQPLTI